MSIPIRGQILQEALTATVQVRQEEYGLPEVNMLCAARFKELYAEYAGGKYSKAHEEAMDRVFIKLARIATGRLHRDNYVDGAAYLAIAFECEDLAK